MVKTDSRMTLIEITTYFASYITQDFGGEDLSERDLMEDLGIDGSVILCYICKKRDEEAWTGLIWLRIGTDGGRL